MPDPWTKPDVMRFLKSKAVAVIATVSQKSIPMAATIYFEVDEQFTFYFMTKTFSRKYENLEHNPEVALVIGTDNDPATVQVQGRATKIVDKKEFDLRIGELQKKFFQNEYIAPMFQLTPEKNELIIYKITPTWIRWLDLREEKVVGDFIQVL